MEGKTESPMYSLVSFFFCLLSYIPLKKPPSLWGCHKPDIPNYNNPIALILRN